LPFPATTGRLRSSCQATTRTLAMRRPSFILFRRRVDATAVLHLIEHESAGAEPENRGRGVPRRRG